MFLLCCVHAATVGANDAMDDCSDDGLVDEKTQEMTKTAKSIKSVYTVYNYVF